MLALYLSISSYFQGQAHTDSSLMTGSLNLSISGETYGRKFINILTLNKYNIVQTKPLFYWEYSEVALYTKYVKVKLDSVFIDQSTQKIFLGKK